MSNKDSKFAQIRISKEAYEYLREFAHQGWESICKSASKIILEHKEKKHV